METGGLSVITIIFWIVAANIILVLSAYGLYKYLRLKAQENIRQIGEQIQAYDAQMNQLAHFLNNYASIDQEPYFTLLSQLQTEAGDLQHQLQEFLDISRAFEAEINTTGANQLQEIINAPYTSFRRWQRSRELVQASTLIAGQITAAEKRMQHIYELPWELASECRQADRQYGELVDAAQTLQSNGVQGEELQQILTQLPLMQRALSRVPQEFFDADHQQLLAAASMEATIRVFESLNAIRPALNTYLAPAKEWVASYQKASAEYTQLKQAGSRLRQALQTHPPDLLVDPLQARLDQVAQMAAEAGAALVHPQAQQIKPLAREINHLLKVLHDTERQYHQAQHQLQELNQALAEGKDLLDQAAAQHSLLENQPVHPLVWDQSGPRLNGLRQQLAGLGPAGSPRAPEQIRQQLKESQALRQEARALLETAPQVAALHGQLLAIFENPRIKEGAAWLRAAREMLALTDAFDPKNWPRQEQLPDLQVEMEALTRQHNQLVPADTSRTIKETEIEQRLKDTQALAEQHKNLYPRVEAVRARLEKLQAMEEEGKDRLAEAWNALDQARLLCQSNPLLAETASNEVDQLMEEIRVLGNEINAREQGEVERKTQKTRAQVDKVNQAFHLWQARLDGAVATLAQQMRDRLAEMDAVAQLDDAQVEQARSALQKEEVMAVLKSETPAAAAAAIGPRAVVERVAARIPRLEHKPPHNSLEVMAEIKRKNDLWQTLHAVQKGLEERSAPLLEAYHEALQARSEAKDRLAEAERLLVEKRAWPPSNQTASQENQSLQPIEEKWNGLKKQQVSAEWAILELGRLAQQYRLAAERVQNLLDRARQDQEKVQDLEWQIESLKQRWLTQSEPSNPVMRESIRDLLSQSDAKVAFIKSQYLRGLLTYNQAVQNLQLLNDELRSARVPVDDKNAVGLNESHRRAEQA